MPIAAQCGACTARYKIVDTAGGRRVRCRRCGKPFVVPGAAAVERGPDLRALADLERKGQVVSANPDSEFENYQAAMQVLSQDDNGQKQAADAKRKSHGRSIHELATPDYIKKNKLEVAKENKKGNLYVTIATRAVIVVMIGVCLWIAIPRIIERLSALPTTAASSKQLDSMGEIRGTATTLPTIFNGIYAYQRPQAQVQRILYYINVGKIGIDGDLHAAPGTQEQLQKWLEDGVKSSGLIPFNEAHLSVLEHLTDLGARPQNFKESNGVYTPDENGSVTVTVPYIRCEHTMNGDNGRNLYANNLDVREIKEPITASSKDELQKAVIAHQWKIVMDHYRNLKYPDKKMWTMYDQGHFEAMHGPATQTTEPTMFQ